MTTEQLLKPRYEVIADYPFNPYKIGDIIETIGDTMAVVYVKIIHTKYLTDSRNLDSYPHLFRKLNWWEKRKAEDMPKRLICKAIPAILKFLKFKNGIWTG